jgi:hypothetical protein
MAKTRKKTASPEPPPPPQVGDKVSSPRSEMVYEICKVHQGGEYVDLHVPGTNLEWFRVRTDLSSKRTTIFIYRELPAMTRVAIRSQLLC